CGGDTKFAMFAEVGAVWLIGVPLAFVGALWLRLPVHFVVLLVHIEEFVKMFLIGGRFLTGRWIKNLVRDVE
ncbi:MAG: MATE family efflux transporter, partial [Clostridiales Family XIII bacterium]|nr:MATE family efflux transporter [Clostridiales Family XIII bacterium]